MKYSRKNRRYADVLAEIHDIHDSFTEEEYYDSLYYILGDSYPDASEEELEEIFEEMLENMSEQQAEDFMSSLGSIGKKIGSGLAQVPNFLGKNPELLSTIGGIAGNLILPGAGGMIGGALGSAAGGLLQNKNAQNNLQQQQQQNPNAIVNPDAAKLNSLMQDPQMQRALMQMSTSNVPIAPLTSNGQTTHVPIANFLHALIRQAQAALQQLDALIPPQMQEALAENFGEDFAGEDLGEALLEETRVNVGWAEEIESKNSSQQLKEVLDILKKFEGPNYLQEFSTFTEQPLNNPNYSVSFGSSQRFPSNTVADGRPRMLVEMFMFLMPGGNVDWNTMLSARKTFLWDVHNCWRNKDFRYRNRLKDMNFVRIDPRYTVPSPSDANDGEVYTIDFLWFKKTSDFGSTKFIPFSNHATYDEFELSMNAGIATTYSSSSNIIDDDIADNSSNTPSTSPTVSNVNNSRTHFGWVSSPEAQRYYFHRVAIYPFNHSTASLADRYPQIRDKFNRNYIISTPKRRLFRYENVLVIDDTFTRNSFIRPGIRIGLPGTTTPRLPWRSRRSNPILGNTLLNSWSERLGVIYMQTLTQVQNLLYGENTHTFAHELGHMLGLSDRNHFVINYGNATDVNGTNIMVLNIANSMMGVAMMEWINVEAAETSVIPEKQDDKSNQHISIYGFHGGRINNLMAVPGGIREPALTPYQLNVIANHWHEVQLDQAVIMLPSGTNIVGFDMSTTPPTYSIDGVTTQPVLPNDQIAYIANPQGVQPNNQNGPLSPIPTMDLLFGITNSNALQNGLNAGTTPFNQMPASNNDAFSSTNVMNTYGIRMNATAAAIWDTVGTQMTFATIPAIGTSPAQPIPRNIYPNRPQLVNILR